MLQGIGFHTSGILIDSPKLATDEDMLNFLAMQPDFRDFNQVSKFGSRCNNCNNYIALAPFPTRLEWAGCIHDCFQSFNVAQVTWHVSYCKNLKTPFTGLQGLESSCSRRWTDWWQQSHNTSSWAAFQRNSFPHSNVIQSECMWHHVTGLLVWSIVILWFTAPSFVWPRYVLGDLFWWMGREQGLNHCVFGSSKPLSPDVSCIISCITVWPV